MKLKVLEHHMSLISLKDVTDAKSNETSLEIRNDHDTIETPFHVIYINYFDTELFKDPILMQCVS